MKKFYQTPAALVTCIPSEDILTVSGKPSLDVNAGYGDEVDY